MKRKLLSLFLVCALVTAALPVSVAADNTGVCFTATNDMLLDLGNAATYSGGSIYVPSRVFSTFGIYYSYFSSDATGMLYNGSKQAYFDLNEGTCYDSYGNYYSASAIYHNGQVYVPVAWTCYYFGLTYSSIGGVGYGDIIRIKNGGEVLTDSQFLDSVTRMMRSRYNEYTGGNNPPPATPSPSTAPAVPSVSADEEGTPGSVTLCFIGLPTDAVLDQLDTYGYKATFFVTADDANGSPDIVRRAYGSGYNIGVYCQSAPESECNAAAEAVFSAVHMRPTLMTSPTATAKTCAAYASEHGYAYYTQRNAFAETTSSASTVTARLEKAGGHVTLTFVSGNGTNKLMGSLPQYLSTKKYTVTPLLETSV